MNNSPYTDKRASFFKEFFESGKTFEEYSQTGSEAQLAKLENFSQILDLTQQQRTVLGSFTRKMNIIVLSGIWCGDCLRQIPLFKKIEDASASAMNFRYIESRDNPELQDELRIMGGTRVPVVVTLSEDFFEIGRFGDRTLSVYRRKAETELGMACDAGLGVAKDDYEIELQEWIDYFERQQLVLRLAPMLRNRYQD